MSRASVYDGRDEQVENQTAYGELSRLHGAQSYSQGAIKARMHGAHHRPRDRRIRSFISMRWSSAGRRRRPFRGSSYRSPYGLRSYWKSTFLRGLPDVAIDTFVRFGEACTSPRTVVVLEHGHGAVTRVGTNETAFPARGHAFDLVVLSLWDDVKEDARNVAWTRDFYEAIQPWAASLVYVNALGAVDGTRVRYAYD